MKTLKFLTIALVALLTLSSCDAVRSFFGKPTSRELSAMTETQVSETQIPAAEPIDEVQQPEAESQSEPIKSNVDELPSRFYVIVGAFKDHSNADKLSARMQKEKYEVTEIYFKDGFKAVALYPSDSYKQALDRLNTLWDIDYLPYDLWVYDTTTHVHE